MLRQADRKICPIERVAACFGDGRAEEDVVHSLRTLVGRRAVAMALGREDVNGDGGLGHDPVPASSSDKGEPRRGGCAAPPGEGRRRQADAPVVARPPGRPIFAP